MIPVLFGAVMLPGPGVLVWASTGSNRRPPAAARRSRPELKIPHADPFESLGNMNGKAGPMTAKAIPAVANPRSIIVPSLSNLYSFRHEYQKSRGGATAARAVGGTLRRCLTPCHNQTDVGFTRPGASPSHCPTGGTFYTVAQQNQRITRCLGKRGKTVGSGAIFSCSDSAGAILRSGCPPLAPCRI